MIETESKKAETYTDASVYEELYRRTEWVAGHSDMPDDTRRQHLHETLVLACREALKESRQGFGSLFAQVDYLCRKHNISAYDTMEIQRMRRNGKAELRQHEQRTSNEVRTQFVPFGAQTSHDCNKDNREQREILYDCRALAVFISAISSTRIPATLTGLIPTEGRQKDKARRIAFKHMRCIALKTEGSITVRPEDGTPVRRLTLDDSQAMLKHIIRDGMTLSLVDVSEDDAAALSAKFVILEPDYLLDISSVAACFTDYGHHPLAYLVNRMKPSANSQAIILGNYAGDVLDAALHNDGSPAEEIWRNTLKQHFATDALTYATCPDFSNSAYKEQCRQQAQNIISIVKEIKRQTAERNSSAAFVLEPSFLCPILGLQGRADLMTDDMLMLVEQKSGKNFCLERHIKNQYGAFQTESHYVQLLLYFAVMHYNFDIPNGKLDMRLMYSRYPLPDGLLIVSYYQQLLAEALMLRNRIVASAVYFAREGFTRDMLQRLTPDTINERKLNNAFYTKYILPELSHILAPLQRLTPTEQDYFCRMTTFIHREQAISCIGAQEGVTHSMADIWNMPFENKMTQGEIIVCMPPEQTLSGVQDLTLKTDSRTEANFRAGDSIILYRFRATEKPDATRAILFKGTVTSMTADNISLHLSDPQLIQGKAIAGSESDTHLWAIEHSYTSAVSSGMKSLHMLASAPAERRDLLLCQTEPQYDADICLSRKYHPAYDDMLLHASRAKDYFLIVGPPGTGKTSMAMRFLVEEWMVQNADSDTAILLTSYTNRAVDEISGMLTEAGIEFLRIGSPYTCDSRYHSQLACRMFEAEGSLHSIRQRIAATRVVVATTSTLMAHQEIMHLKRFALTIVDEASQILEPSIIGLLAIVEKFILIGDIKQLPAVVQQSTTDSAVSEPRLIEIGLTDCRNSLFERMIRHTAKHHSAASAQPLIATLRRQGRMHPDIAAWPNSMFYRDEKMMPVPLPHQQEQTMSYNALPADRLDQLITEHRMLFIDVKPEGDGRDSKSNSAEAKLCADIIRRIRRMAANCWNPKKTVGVIVPYRNQISLIRQEIERLCGTEDAAEITIDTVERYQGSQRDIIIYSFTVSQPHQLEFLTASTFTAQPIDGKPYLVDRKLNVALTRARKQMIMLGNSHLLRRNAIFRNLIDATAININEKP